MENRILLVRKTSQEEHQDAYGHGGGSIITTVYSCPCGKGTVVHEKDDTPGFKDSSTWAECEECKGKYEFGKGYATLK